MASDGTSDLRLRAAFDMWAAVLKGVPTQYPPYLLHKLEHQYNENSLELNALHGNDLSVVQCLKRTCEQTGADLYLATYEKTVHKDDDCDDEVFDRDEEIQSLFTLGGHPVAIKPDYDSSYWLEAHDPEADEDKDADESEHEGWTGNEGSPAKYWYRDTVVMIMPKSQKLAFSLSHKDKWSMIQNKLTQLHQQAKSDSNAREELRKYCEVIVSSQPERSNGYSWYPGYVDVSGKEKQRQACLSDAALVCLQNRWMSMFWQLPAQQKIRHDCLQELGRLLAATGKALHSQANLEFELVSIVRCASGIAQKHEVLQNVRSAFQEAGPSPDQQQIFERCCSLAVKEVVNQSSGLSRADMSALASVARGFGPEVVTPLVLSLPDDHTENLTEFVIGLSDSMEKQPQSALHKLQIDVLEKLWNGFQYTMVREESVVAEERRSGDHWRMPFPGIPAQTGLNRIAGLTFSDLSTLLTMTKTHNVNMLSAALRDMTEAIVSANSRYISERLLDFVKSILAHEVPALIVEDDPDLFGAVSEYIYKVLSVVVSRHIGQEPMRPKDWSISERGCGNASCTDCRHVEKFMADPKESVLTWRIGVNRIEHLEYKFGTDDYYRTSQCNTITDKKTKPATWTRRKEHKTYNKKYSVWAQRRKEIQAKLFDMAGKDGVGLKVYLSDKTDLMLRCRAEDLPQTDTSGANALTDHGGSNLNVKNNKKRASDQHESDSAAKRSRGTAEDPVEVVELSD